MQLQAKAMKMPGTHWSGIPPLRLPLLHLRHPSSTSATEVTTAKSFMALQPSNTTTVRQGGNAAALSPQKHAETILKLLALLQ